MKLNKFRPSHLAVYLILILAAFISIFPFYFMFVSGTNSNAEILQLPPSLSVGTHLMENFAMMMTRIDLWRVTFNSFVVAISFTILAVIFYSMAGYALAKFAFKGKKTMFMLVMLTMMLPAQVTYIPRYILATKLGWVDDYTAVILPPLANAFGIFLMRQNLYAIPDALLEAARLDGCSEMRIFWRVVMPNMKPAISALGIYMFMNSWNNFLWPLITLNSTSMQTWQLALSVLNGAKWEKQYGVIMLAAGCATLPILLIFLFFQKHFVAGVMGRSIKE